MPVAFDVERFERVDASSGTALLRLSGTFTSETPTEIGRPELVVDDGRNASRVHPLPDPAGGSPSADAGGREWRAAFPVPASLLDGGRVAFALEASGAGVIDLPRP